VQRHAFAYTRVHADGVRAVYLLDVDSYKAIQQGHMDCSSCGMRQFLEQWPNQLIEAESVDEAAGKPEEFQTEAIV
jgi:hypothetical protein